MQATLLYLYTLLLALISGANAHVELGFSEDGLNHRFQVILGHRTQVPTSSKLYTSRSVKYREPNTVFAVPNMSQIEIRTPRLLLRGAKQDDLVAYHQWFCDPETMNFWYDSTLSGR